MRQEVLQSCCFLAETRYIGMMRHLGMADDPLVKILEITGDRRIIAGTGEIETSEIQELRTGNYRIRRQLKLFSYFK